jgi:hypothetical protein
MSLKDRLKKVVRKIEGYGSMAVAAIAPVMGAIILGPAGAAAGTALGTAATRYGVAQLARSKGTKGMEARTAGREFAGYSLMYGGAVTGIAGGLALAGGTGIATSSLTSIGNIFAPSTPKGGGGWESGGLLDQLYNSGANTTGLSAPSPPASGPSTTGTGLLGQLFGAAGSVGSTGAQGGGASTPGGGKNGKGKAIPTEVLLIGGAVVAVALFMANKK